MSSAIEVANLRKHPRFIFDDPMPALFNGVEVRVLNLSGGGLMLEHADAFKVGSSASVRIASAALQEETTFRAKVVWSKLSSTTNDKGKMLYRSGLSILDASAETLGFLGRLIRTFGRADKDSMERKRQALMQRQKGYVPPSAEPAKPKYSPEQLLMIQQAYNRLAKSAGDAQKYYEQAKLSLAQQQRPVMHKKEALAIWEYLGEQIDLDLVQTVLQAM